MNMPSHVGAALLALAQCSLVPQALAGPAAPASIEDIATPVIRTAPSLGLRRYDPVTVLLQDGRVMIAGGASSPTTTGSIELYDPASGSLGAIGDLGRPREAAVGVALPNGLVLVAGGANRAGSGVTHSNAELFDPVTLQSNATGSMAHRREQATANLLANGKVLVAGGVDYGELHGPDDPDPEFGLSSAELFDPLTGSFAATGSMSIDRYMATSVMLADGRVLIIGGVSFNGGVLTTSEIYDPVTGQFGNVASLPGAPRQSPTAILLANGKVLVAGGAGYQSSALLYTPSTNSYATTGSMAVGRIDPSAALMADGSVLIIGGQRAQFQATPTIERYDPATGTFSTVGNLATARSRMAVSLLPDGRIVAAGGYVPPPNNSQGIQILATSEIIDPRGFARVAGGSPTLARSTPMSTSLADGRVLFAGGTVASSASATTEIYSATTNLFTAGGAMAQARQNATLNLMPDGSAVVIGGSDANGNALASAERFDPSTNTFSATQRPLWQARTSAASALLPDGKLLIAGGRNASGPLASAEIYDAHTRLFRVTAPLAIARSEMSAVTLPDGRVLVVGGRDASTAIASAELYDPLTRSFSPTTSLATARRSAITTLLPSGKVLVAGGYGASGALLASAELFDPASETFTATGAMPSARADTRAIVTTDGRVLIVGGAGGGNDMAYDPWRGVFEFVSTGIDVARRGAAVLPDGRVLTVGSVTSAGATSLIVAHPGIEAAATVRPNLAPTPTSVALPGVVELTGLGLRGSRRLTGAGSVVGSEGDGGGRNGAATNFPLLRLQRIDNQQVTYQAPAAHLPWTDLVFTTPTLTRFDSWDPGSRMAGTYRVSVVANGIESQARYVSLYWIEDSIFASGFQPGD